MAGEIVWVTDDFATVLRVWTYLRTAPLYDP